VLKQIKAEQEKFDRLAKITGPAVDMAKTAFQQRNAILGPAAEVAQAS
jgi:hypothetical protein